MVRHGRRLLAGHIGEAGVDVELVLTPVPAVSAGLDLTAYRIVQEALTNVCCRAARCWSVCASGAALFGGWVEAGQRGDGFAVRAVLPLSSTASRRPGG